MSKLRSQFQGNDSSYRYRVIRKIVGFLSTSLSIKSGYKIIKFLEYFNVLQGKYFYYYLFSSLLEKEFNNFLAKGNFKLAYEKKIRWAKLILQYSDWDVERESVSSFLRILAKNGYTKTTVINDYPDFPLKNVSKVSSENFYLYGPNSKYPPNIKYKDYIIVLTKPIEDNIDKFKSSMLFINAVYFNKKIKNNPSLKNQLLQKYGKIYVSTMHVLSEKDIHYSIMPASSALCSLMGLGRIINHLVVENGRLEVVIEGYDMYLNKKMYDKSYDTAEWIQTFNDDDEKHVAQGLSSHDPLYNFLIMKELIEYVNLIDNDELKKIIKMTGNEYMERLLDVRKFELLN